MTREPHPGKEIQHYRKRRKMTQQQLADALHVNRVTLNRIETGAASISPEMAARLERVLYPNAGWWLSQQASYDLARIESDPRLMKEINKCKWD